MSATHRLKSLAILALATGLLAGCAAMEADGMTGETDVRARPLAEEARYQDMIRGH